MQTFGHTKTRKISKKSATWHRHGKHRPVLMELRGLERQRLRREPPVWYATIREALNAANIH